MADMESIRNGSHDGTDGQAIEVIVNEDNDAKHSSENLGHLRILDMLRDPFCICARTTAYRNDYRESA